MKIALCLECPIAEHGGMSVLVKTLLEEFVPCGHQIILVSNDPAGSLDSSETGRLVQKHISWDAQPTVAKARQLAERLAETNVALAHFHFGNYGWGNRFLGRCPIPYLNRQGIPCVTTTHMAVGILDGYCGPQKPLWFKLGLLPLAWLGKMHQLFHVRAEIAVSRQNLRKLRRWYLPLRRRFRLIYHSRLRDRSILPAAAPRDRVILNVGHVAWRKGQGVLAEAFAQIAPRHPGWTLQLVGQDTGDGTAEYIRQIASQHQLENRLLLLGEQTDVQSLMQRAAIYVQPAFWEGLPMALQEAMFNGCPAIGTMTGGIPELIDDGRTGLLVSTGDAARLAGALEKLLRDTQKREDMGKAAAAAIRQRGMTLENTVKNHLDMYAEFCRPNNQKRPVV
jgi:glycosyltransferase involved in cell wall biosynthesis